MTDEQDAEARTRAALNDAIKAHAEPHVADGEVIVAWIVLAGTRSLDDGGATIALVSDSAVPRWQAKGMLVDALDLARRLDQDDDPL